MKANTAEPQRGGERRRFEAELETDSDLKTTTLFFYSLEWIKRGEGVLLATGDINPGGSPRSHPSSQRKGGGRVIFGSKFGKNKH